MKDKILEMAAGVLLDSLVAEDVMGWKERVDFDVVDGMIARYIPNTNDVEQFSPSIDISAAWEVVEKLKGNGEFDLYWFSDHWSCWFGKNEGANAETAPLAICKAGLLAVMDS